MGETGPRPGETGPKQKTTLERIISNTKEAGLLLFLFFLFFSFVKGVCWLFVGGGHDIRE